MKRPLTLLEAADCVREARAIAGGLRLDEVEALLRSVCDAQRPIDGDTIATLTHQVLSYQEQLEDKAALREAIVMAENRLEAALKGGEVCKDCVELARSYLTDALAGSVALSSTDREYDPNVAPCDDAEFGMKP